MNACLWGGGANGGTRTPDRLITNQTHYQTVLRWPQPSVDNDVHEVNGRDRIEHGQVKEEVAPPQCMDEEPVMQYLSSQGRQRTGDDVIFSWLARYRHAAAAGADAVNGTVGAMLEDNGQLAINATVDAALRQAPAVEFAAYAPLKGLPDYLDLSVTLALGEHRQALEALGLNHIATATPGGSGALFLAASNFTERNDRVLLRDRHWGPYKGFLRGVGLGWATYPLLPGPSNETTPFFDRAGFETELNALVEHQTKVMVWINDPAHNPTGLSLPPASRLAMLESFMESALRHEHIGHTLVIDAAYHLYAQDPHGWAETLLEVMNQGWPWPENMLVCMALSLSKSHTAYGLRAGALICLHPDEKALTTLRDIMGVTGRETWSAAPRLAQYTFAHLHSKPSTGQAWANERDRLSVMLDDRRTSFVTACNEHGVAINPTHDGFFAWFECNDPVAVAEACAQDHVYLVPLEGGVRIGLCAIPVHQVDRVAKALADSQR